MKRSYYENSITNFLTETENSILSELVRHHEFSLEDLQRDAWISQIRVLKEELQNFPPGYIFFEYSIPRMGKRVDVILLTSGLVFVIEFKVGETSYPRSAIEQVLDYALDLKNFHAQSHNKIIIPVLFSTEAKIFENKVELFEDRVVNPQKLSSDNFEKTIQLIIEKLSEAEIDPIQWTNSIYKPTPTIIEAAQALYQGHEVKEISRSDASAYNLAVTTNSISNIIDRSKEKNEKSICFITGVPGSGKTLAGLNIANQRQNIDQGEHAVFLSGNGPLVKVLREALARYEVKNTPNMTKKSALQKTSVFIQNIHHFRDDALATTSAPVERVVIFDEAQRAWTKDQTANFMMRKRGVSNFKQSEPEFLISVMDRHTDWATIICLIGGGQEINTGEAGLPEWFIALEEKFADWKIYVSDKLTDNEYTWGKVLFTESLQKRINYLSDLHLCVSVRSFRSEKVSKFVKELLDLNLEEAQTLYNAINSVYPIVVTRDLDDAKNWLRKKARGSERFGILASSGAHRLRPFGLNIKAGVTPEYWFLNDKSDVRSSFFLEEVSTEFDIQGLELDWTCLAWGANFRFTSNGWEFKNFRGTTWQNINNETQKQYLINSYRVLLTRARQGMVIFVPEGTDHDHTRKKEYYDGIFEYLDKIGIQQI